MDERWSEKGEESDYVKAEQSTAPLSLFLQTKYIVYVLQIFVVFGGNYEDEDFNNSILMRLFQIHAGFKKK